MSGGLSGAWFYISPPIILLLLKPRNFISVSNLSRHKMSNEKELEEIIINKGEMVYKELVEREGRESTGKGYTSRVICIRLP